MRVSVREKMRGRERDATTTSRVNHIIANPVNNITADIQWGELSV